MSSEYEGAPECDPQKKQKVAKAVEEFEDRVRHRVQRLTAARTGARIPFNRVHLDPRSCDTYQRLMLVVIKAAMEHDPAAGMEFEPWITWRLFHTDADASFFEGPLTVPYATAMDYLSAKNSSEDPEEQRDHWEDLGRDPLDFDTIRSSLEVQNWSPPTQGRFKGDDSASENELADTNVVPSPEPGPDAYTEAQLFLTNDLTEVEALAWKYHEMFGYTFEKIGRDLLPAHLFDNSGTVKHRVRRIWLRAKAKAEDFRNTDGSDL